MKGRCSCLLNPYLLILSALIALSCTGPASSQQKWKRTYGGTGDDWGSSVQPTSDGGYIVSGYTFSFGAGNTDAYLIKTDASGDTLWMRTYGGTGNEFGHSVQHTADGGYILAGSTDSYGAGANDVYLVKTDVSGDTLWTRTYGGTGGDAGNSVQQTSDGGYIVAGYTGSFGAGNTDAYLIKTDASGDTLWTRTYGGAGTDLGTSVQQTTDGGYIIAGGTNSFGGGYRVYLIRTNASGDTLWTQTYGGSNDWGNSVRQTSDGGYLIAGYTGTYGAGGGDAYLIKTDGSGGLLWTRTYGGTDVEESNSAQQTSDGGYIIAGYTHSFGAGGYDVYLIKTDANGIAGVEEERVQGFKGSRVQGFKATPNPFFTFTTLPGHEGERFELYDITGRKAGTFRGDRIGEGLAAGVYFLRSANGDAKPVRIVKVR